LRKSGGPGAFSMSQQLLRSEYQNRISRIINKFQHIERKYLCYLIVGHWDVHTYLKLVKKLISKMTLEESEAWLSNFTKTIILVGNVDKLSNKVNFTEREGMLACKLSVAGTKDDYLSRLLKPMNFGRVEDIAFSGSNDVQSGSPGILYISAAIDNLPRAIVNAQHALAEGLLDMPDTRIDRIIVTDNMPDPLSSDIYVRIEHDISNDEYFLRALLRPL
jgi:hypothetical protein